MTLRSEQYGDTSNSSGFQPREWLTPEQRNYSVNFTGSQRHRNLADAIRGQEVIGSDGAVRTKAGLSIPYDSALGMLGMGVDSWTPTQSAGSYGSDGS